MLEKNKPALLKGGKTPQKGSGNGQPSGCLQTMSTGGTMRGFLRMAEMGVI